MDDKELLIIMEVDTDPTGKVCVVFTRKGKALVKIVGEPIPGFFLSEGGSIHPRHALRGIAIVSISEMEDPCE
ncbi:hypothetical protein KQH40_00840 [bacterium]|nr:hypothetical protein [bacterium]